MFVHLRLHTEFSVIDGANRIDEVVAAAAADGQPALAITDLSNLFGAIKFYKAARGAGVKPIVGAEIQLEGLGPDGAAPPRMLLLVQDRQGYLNLSELLARAWTGNVVKAQALVRLEWLEELGAGLILLSGAQAGPIGQALLQGDPARARELAVRLAAELALPVVATHPVQFMRQDDYEAHEARVCIAEGEILGNPRRVRRFTTEQYFKSSAEMQALFADIPSALANAQEVARRCNLTLELGRPRLPDFPIPAVDGKQLSTEEYFRHVAERGLQARLAQRYPDSAERGAERARYEERLAFEIATIVKMGFPGYCLIVGDFINWAKNNGCPVGPGRGSGAGSLVAYALGISGETGSCETEANTSTIAP